MTDKKEDIKENTLASIELEMFRWGRRRGEEKEKQKKVVYETEVNGVRTLDLYSGWAVEGEEHKFKLFEVPIKLCRFRKLERIWLSHNHLSDLPSQLDQLTELRELFLHYNSFKTMPSCIFRMPKLEILWLSSNEIQEVPPAISNVKSLRQVHLEHNSIDQFQEELCNLPCLEVLYLNHNQLTTVNPNISQLAGILRRLYLNMNKISSIPETICLLEKLEVLYLHDNKITSVPAKFEAFCSTLKETNKAIIQVNNNPYVLPKPRVKISVGGPPPTLQIQQPGHSRRYSDDFRQRGLSQPSAIEHRYSVPSAPAPIHDRPGSGRKSATLHR